MKINYRILSMIITVIVFILSCSDSQTVDKKQTYQNDQWLIDLEDGEGEIYSDITTENVLMKSYLYNNICYLYFTDSEWIAKYENNQIYIFSTKTPGKLVVKAFEFGEMFLTVSYFNNDGSFSKTQKIVSGTVMYELLMKTREYFLSKNE